MSGDLKEKLAAALGVKVQPVCHVQQVYNQYARSMSGMKIETPLPETVHLCDENFTYWIKLQRHNPDTNTWQDASSAKVLPLSKAGTFDQNGYRQKTHAEHEFCPIFPIYCAYQSEFM